MNIYLDIETEPKAELIDLWKSNLKYTGVAKDPEKIKVALEKKEAGYWKAMATDPDYAKIKLIAVKVNDEPAKILAGLSEFSDLLLEFEKANCIKDGVHEKCKIITFNGKAFDLPVIIRNGIREKAGLPYKYLQSMTKKWSTDIHIDLMEQLSETKGWKSLDILSKIYGLGDMEHKEIDFENCTMEELTAHALEDVETTAKYYKLFERLF